MIKIEVTHNLFDSADVKRLFMLQLREEKYPDMQIIFQNKGEVNAEVMIVQKKGAGIYVAHLGDYIIISEADGFVVTTPEGLLTYQSNPALIAKALPIYESDGSPAIVIRAERIIDQRSLFRNSFYDMDAEQRDKFLSAREKLIEEELIALKLQISVYTGKKIVNRTVLQDWYNSISLEKEPTTVCECCFKKIDNHGHKSDCEILLEYNKHFTL